MPCLFIRAGAGQAFRWDLSVRQPSSDWTTPACLAGPHMSRERSTTSMPRMASSRCRMRSLPKARNPHIGSEFELNDYRGVIVGIAKVTMSGLVRHPDPVHDLRARPSNTFPIPATRSPTCSWNRRVPTDIPRIKQQVEALGYLARTKEEFMQRTCGLLHLPDRRRHQHADHDRYQLYRRPVDLGSNVLHVHPGKPGTVRSAEGHRHKKPRLGRHDSVPGHFTAFTGLRPGGRAVRALDLARKAKASQLRRHDHLRESGDVPSAWCSSLRRFQLRRGSGGF